MNGEEEKTSNIAKAVKFLLHPSVSAVSPRQRRLFLSSKGFSEREVNDAFQIATKTGMLNAFKPSQGEGWLTSIFHQWLLPLAASVGVYFSLSNAWRHFFAPLLEEPEIDQPTDIANNGEDDTGEGASSEHSWEMDNDHKQNWDRRDNGGGIGETSSHAPRDFFQEGCFWDLLQELADFKRESLREQREIMNTIRQQHCELRDAIAKIRNVDQASGNHETDLTNLIQNNQSETSQKVNFPLSLVEKGNTAVLGEEVEKCLECVVAGSSYGEEVKALNTLWLVMNLLLRNPADSKYRRVNTSTPRFTERFTNPCARDSACHLLEVLGFKRQGDVFIYENESVDIIQTTKQKIEEAMTRHSSDCLTVSERISCLGENIDENHPDRF